MSEAASKKTKIRYVGPFLSADVQVGAGWITVANGETFEVEESIAPGLLAQEANFEAAGAKKTSEKGSSK